MRIVLDECLPTRLHKYLPGHDAHSVQILGWLGKRNGELLSLMQANGYTVLLTVDRNLQYQQNLAQHSVAVIVLVAPTN